VTVIEKILLCSKYLKDTAIANIKKVKELYILGNAKGWQRIYALKNWFFNSKSNYGERLGLLFLIVLIAISIVYIPELQSYLEPYLALSERLASITSLFLTLGGALIGATAIAFSLIMFAMQVNVERMPHGLFRKFSSDLKLLGAFIATFSLAVLITGLSLIPDKSWVATAVVTTVWSSLLIIWLFMIAYRRALDLISPTIQLRLVVVDTEKNFNIWDRAAKRTTPLFRANSETEDEVTRSNYDMDRATYFRLNPNWTTNAEQAISYCITFSRRYAEQGDYEISYAALTGIVAINAFYIKTKGKTFFSDNYLIDNPLASDSLLSNTLEHLRQNVQVGISRKDEQFIEQNFQALFQLTQLYLSIDYGDENAVRSHAQLVSGYLKNAVERVVPHDMADVLIDGVTQLGNTARIMAQYNNPEYTATLSEQIALIACTGAVNKNYQPVTQVAVKQLASLTFELLCSKSWEVIYAINEVRDDVKMIAEIYLNTADTPLMSIHSVSMAPYYSGTSNDSLMSRLTELTNALLEAESKNEDAQRIIRHIVKWADGLYHAEKELLLMAIEKKSHLTFDLVHWIVHITKLLIAVSCADACDKLNSGELRKSAQWLIAVLSSIPDDEETIRYIETYRIADKFVEVALDAHKRGCDNEATEIRKLLLAWTFKAGKYDTGWASLETACCGLASLNIIFGLPDEDLTQEIDMYLSRKKAPSIDIRSRAVTGLLRESEKYRTGFGLNSIDTAMLKVDQAKLRVLLRDIAGHLSK